MIEALVIRNRGVALKNIFSSPGVHAWETEVLDFQKPPL